MTPFDRECARIRAAAAASANGDGRQADDKPAGAPAEGPAPPEWEEPLPIGAGGSGPEFPADVLPGWLGRWVEAVAVATQTPRDLAALLVLAIAGAGLATKFRIVPRPGWTESTNLLTVVALNSGERKSNVFALAMEPVEEREAAEVARLAPVIAEAESARRILEGRLKVAEAKAAKAENPEDRAQCVREAKELAKELVARPVPVAPQLFCDDVTPEQLAHHLAQQEGRMLQASAEGTAFEIAKGRYSETANFDVYLKGHAGDFLRVGRVGREADSVARPALSAALAVQPDVIAGLAEDAILRGRGFLARWLYALPDSKVGSRQVAAEPVPADVAQGYRTGMLSLWATTGGVDAAGKPAPHLLRFAAAADALMQEFERWLEPQLGDGEPLSYLAGWANKLAGAAARIAGILHVATSFETDASWAEPISEATVATALRLARGYLVPHAEVAFALMAADPLAQDARRAVRWLQERICEPVNRVNGGLVSASAVVVVSQRDLHAHVFGGRRRVDEVEAVVALLVKLFYLRPEAATPARKGHKTSPRYEVNPALAQKRGPRSHGSHGSQNSGEG
jgi:hypothetical protein